MATGAFWGDVGWLLRVRSSLARVRAFVVRAGLTLELPEDSRWSVSRVFAPEIAGIATVRRRHLEGKFMLVEARMEVPRP